MANELKHNMFVIPEEKGNGVLHFHPMGVMKISVEGEITSGQTYVYDPKDPNVLQIKKAINEYNGPPIRKLDLITREVQRVMAPRTLSTYENITEHLLSGDTNDDGLMSVTEVKDRGALCSGISVVAAGVLKDYGYKADIAILKTDRPDMLHAAVYEHNSNQFIQLTNYAYGLNDSLILNVDFIKPRTEPVLSLNPFTGLKVEGEEFSTYYSLPPAENSKNKEKIEDVPGAAEVKAKLQNSGVRENSTESQGQEIRSIDPFNDIGTPAPTVENVNVTR